MMTPSMPSNIRSENCCSLIPNRPARTRLRLRQDKFTLKRTLSELDYQIRQAKDDFERGSKLFADKVISEQEFTKLKIAFERLSKQRDIEVENQQFQEENRKPRPYAW